MIIARQSTARTVTVGPVLDASGVAVTDGVVADFKIAKNGGAPAALNASATLTHRHTGHYSLALTATDLDTVGQAEIVIDDTVNACPAKEITVIEEAVYDGTFAASAGALATAAALTTVDDFLDTEVAAILAAVDTEVGAIKTKTDFLPSATAGAAGGLFIAGANAATSVTTALTANITGNVSGSVGSVTGAVGSVTGAVASVTGNVGGNVTGNVGGIASGGLTAASLDATVQARMGILGYGTASAAAAATVTVAAGTGSLYKAGSIIGVLGSTQAYYQWRVIVSVSTDTLTVDAWDVTPSGTITYVAFAAAPASATALPTVLLSNGTGTGQVSLSSGTVTTGALSAGAITATAIAADAFTAAKFAADVTTEFQSGLATAAALTTVDTVVDSILVDTAEIGAAGAGLTALASAANLATVAGYLDTEVAAILAAVDTEVAAIKAKTDNLPAAPAATGDIPSASVIADAIHDEVIEGSYTFRQYQRLFAAALGAIVSGAGTTTITFRDTGNTKNRIVATVDVDGNRSATTLDLT